MPLIFNQKEELSYAVLSLRFLIETAVKVLQNNENMLRVFSDLVPVIPLQPNSSMEKMFCISFIYSSNQGGLILFE